MKTNLNKISRGFTIIEVMIVLAIAGLIIAIVFIAVPQLQRNARDNQRESIANRLSAELTTYSGNNQGLYPFAGTPGATPPGTLCNTQAASGQNCGDWYSRYINGKVTITDPTTGANTNVRYFSPTAAGTYTWVSGDGWIAVGSSCSGENGYTAGAGSSNATAKKFALTVALDRNNTFYCVDNG